MRSLSEHKFQGRRLLPAIFPFSNQESALFYTFLRFVANEFHFKDAKKTNIARFAWNNENYKGVTNVRWTFARFWSQEQYLWSDIILVEYIQLLNILNIHIKPFNQYKRCLD